MNSRRGISTYNIPQYFPQIFFVLSHLWQTEQWWALSGLILQHFGHLKITLKFTMFTRLSRIDSNTAVDQNLPRRWRQDGLHLPLKKSKKKSTCPSSNPILWIFSFVAFPFGTAPVAETCYLIQLNTAPVAGICLKLKCTSGPYLGLWAWCGGGSWRRERRGPDLMAKSGCFLISHSFKIRLYKIKQCLREFGS